ncbi:MAG: sulfatase-like hydrolase/transferase, partial [Acidimicrobiales bacterium]|nr:sulfatase-like hydrolase/transferase [Acidimicrobiales bacterium]
DVLDLPDEGADMITVGGFEALRDAGKVREAIHAYLAAVSFADAQLGRIMDAFAASPIAESATVVLWSDHGRHLGEKMHWSKNTLWERSTRVPFLISSPSLPKRGYKWPVSLLDMAPTLSRLSGLPDEPTWDGRTLTAQIGSPAAAHANPALMYWEDGNVAVRWKRWRLIQYRSGEIELYNRGNDPDEHYNLAVGDWQSNPLRVAAVDAMQAAIPPRFG